MDLFHFLHKNSLKLEISFPSISHKDLSFDFLVIIPNLMFTQNLYTGHVGGSGPSLIEAIEDLCDHIVTREELRISMIGKELKKIVVPSKLTIDLGHIGKMQGAVGLVRVKNDKLGVELFN